MCDINQSTEEKGSGRVCQKPISEARLAANRRNATLTHGRPRLPFDVVNWDRLRSFGGGLNKDIARSLGVSVRTLQRRKRDRQQDESPIL